MSYDSKLAQTGRRVANARRKYYGSFDYGSGIDARLRGGTFSFSRKHAWGGPDGKTWIPEIDETEVDEPDVQAMIAKYFRKHPNDAWKFGKDPETGLDYGAGFEGMSSGGTNWGGLATLGLGMIGSGIQGYNSRENKSNALNQKYDVFGTNEFTGLTDNNALLSTMANTPMLSGATAKDFRDKTVGQDILSALSTGVNATIASGGNYWVGLGATVLDAGKSIWERFDAKNRAKEASLEAKRKNHQFLKDMSVASQDVDARNDWIRMLGYYNNPYLAAFGGPLHSNGGDYNGGLTYIDEGGRHEENPYEGVPSGFDEEGNPNLVEEGEVIWNNEYVFSDRLKVPKELANKYKLGGKKDYTFAEAIEKLTKENTISPNDFITIATTKEIVNEFMDAQETIREENQLAAREELEAARADDFLAQLNAAQGMAPSMGTPIDLGQMGALPNEAPVTEGEMMPPGYAAGGEKGHRPGYEERRKQGYSRLYEDELIELLNQYPLLNERRKAERAKTDAQEKMEAYRSGEIGTTNNERVQGYINNLRRLRSAEKTLSEMPDDIMKLAFGGNKFYGGGWENLMNYLGNTYNKSLTKGGIAGTYAIDKKFPLGDFKTIEELEQSDNYRRFTDYVIDHSDDEDVQAYLKLLDKRTHSGVTKLFENGKLRKGWEDLYRHRRNDHAGGIYHFSAYVDNILKGLDAKQASKEPTPEDEQKRLMGILQGVPFPGKVEGYPDLRYVDKDGHRYYLDTSTIKFYDDLSKVPGYKAPEKPQAGGRVIYTYPSGNKITVNPDGTVSDPEHGASYSNYDEFLSDPSWSLNLEESVVSDIKKSGPLKGTKSVSDLNATEHDDVIPFKYRPTWQREAPVIGSAMAALYGMLNRPDYSNADRVIEAASRVGRPINIPVETIGDYRRRNPFDERYLVNMANQNRAAAARGIANTAGGNRAMDLLGNMSLAHSSQYDLGEIMRQAYLANRQDDAQVADFNRGTNIYNMNAINQRNLSQAQLNSSREQAALSGLERGYSMRQGIKDSWDSATLESLNTMLASIGAIGKENEEYNMMTSMAEHGYYPYFYGDRGIMQYIPQKTAIGGKLNRKKRRF